MQEPFNVVVRLLVKYDKTRERDYIKEFYTCNMIHHGFAMRMRDSAKLSVTSGCLLLFTSRPCHFKVIGLQSSLKRCTSFLRSIFASFFLLLKSLQEYLVLHGVYSRLLCCKVFLNFLKYELSIIFVLFFSYKKVQICPETNIRLDLRNPQIN